MYKFPLKLLFVPFSLILTPLIILIFVLPAVILRQISISLSKLFLPKNSKILSPISSIFTTDNFQKPRCTLVLAAIVEGTLDKNEVVNRIHKVLDAGLYPEMRQKLRRWMGFYYWEDCSDFNLDYHLKFQEDFTSAVNENEVRRMRSDLLKRPYDPLLPLWEAWVCPFTASKDNGNVGPKSVVIFRVHHCVADGYSLLNGFRDFNEADLKTSKPHFIQRTLKQKIVFCFRFLTITPIDLLLSNWNARDVNNAFKIKHFSGESFGFEADTVELETLKEIAKKFGVSVSAVIFSGFAAALRDTFLKKKWDVPQKFHVVCALPLDMKTLMGERKNLTNVMTLLPFPAPIDESNPLRRLKAIEKTFKRKKNSELALGYSLLFKFAGLMASLTQRENGSSFGSAFWTNFPGPKNQQFVFGKQINSFRFTTDFHNDNVAFGFASICFNGQVLLSCKADKNLFPEASMTKEFIERVTQEYNYFHSYSVNENDFV